DHDRSVTTSPIATATLRHENTKTRKGIYRVLRVLRVLRFRDDRGVTASPIAMALCPLCPSCPSCPSCPLCPWTSSCFTIPHYGDHCLCRSAQRREPVPPGLLHRRRLGDLERPGLDRRRQPRHRRSDRQRAAPRPRRNAAGDRCGLEGLPGLAQENRE